MELKDLETFVFVVKSGGVTNAASVLHVTQPGISRRIDRLEKALECTLFERIGNQLILTKEGKTLFSHAEEVLRNIRDLKKAVEVEKGGLRSASIALSGTLAETPFTEKLRQLRRRFPALQHLSIKTTSSAEVSELVAQGEYDLGFRLFADSHPYLVYIQVGMEPLVMIRAAESRWFSDVREITLEQLNEVPWIAFPKGTGSTPSSHITAILDTWLEQSGIRPGPRIDADCLAAQQKLVQADFGIALIPFSSVQDACEKGKLSILSLPGTALHVPIFAVYRKTAPHREALSEIADFFR